MNLSADFYNELRPMFPGGKLTSSQVAGIQSIYGYGSSKGLPASWTAYSFATAYHETGARLQPVREGFATSDEQAMRVIAGMLHSGRIKENYAERHPITGQSYYGRGLVQITWYDNYLKFEKLTGIPFTTNPDLMLRNEYAVPVLFTGSIEGMFRRGRSYKKLLTQEFGSLAAFKACRDVINGDSHRTRNGIRYDTMIAEYAMAFQNALRANKE